MADAYSLQWFLLRAKQDHLKELFQRQGLLIDVPFVELEDGDIGLVFAAIQDLGPELRETFEACFQEIYALANRGGIDAIHAASRSKLLTNHSDEDLMQRFGQMGGYLDRAFWTFLYRPQYWEFAGLLAGADSISAAAWDKHPSVPSVAPCLHPEALNSLGRALGHYFHTMEGRGNRCDVRVCDRADRIYVVCLLEQTCRADPEWRPEGLRRRTHKPAQPLTFMYSQIEGELDTYLKAKPRVVWDVAAIFARHILGLKKLDPPPKGRGVYRLDQFKQRGTIYTFGSESGISRINVRKLRLTPRFGPKRHIVIEGNPTGNQEPVYDMIEKDLFSISMDDVDVTQVELKVEFDRTPYRKKRTISPTITVPNRCSLGYDDLELTVRKMLIASGIELKEPKETGGQT
jgi:hypothetical protein